MKTFFLQIWQIFHTDFKNVSLTLVKSAPKKSFSQKTVFSIKSVFEQNFFGALFTKVIK
jgi:hypothetical protein